MKTTTRRLQIVNPLGLHARAAARVAMVAQKAAGAVWIGNGRERADAGSIIDILALACAKGGEVTLEIEDPADIKILERLTELIRDGFGE